MSEEVAVYEKHDIGIVRDPELVLSEAQKAAKALGDVISRKKKPFILNGEQYLEFEDWQTVGRFYGVTAKIISTEYIDYGEVNGFQARAVAIRSDGMEISAAEAMCLNDESNWKTKPLFQLRSMAQTRACAKALRNVLAWVVVLAGYKPTPAEEMQVVDSTHRDVGQKPPLQPPQSKSQKSQSKEEVISEAQRKRFYAIARTTGSTDDQIKDWLLREYDIEHSKDITKDLYDEICTEVREI